MTASSTVAGQINLCDPMAPSFDGVGIMAMMHATLFWKTKTTHSAGIMRQYVHSAQDYCVPQVLGILSKSANRLLDSKSGINFVKQMLSLEAIDDEYATFQSRNFALPDRASPRLC